MFKGFRKKPSENSEDSSPKVMRFEDKVAGGHRVIFIVCGNEDSYWDQIGLYYRNSMYQEGVTNSSWKPGGYDLAKTWNEVVGVGMGDSYRNCGQFTYFVNIEAGEDSI